MSWIGKVMLAVVIVCGAVALARAGLKSPDNVTISGMSAFGGVGAARANGVDNHRIGCSIGGDTTSGSYSGSCYAIASGNNPPSRFCYWTGQAFYNVFKRIGLNSHIYFTIDANGRCTDAIVTNASYFQPMVP